MLSVTNTRADTGAPTGTFTNSGLTVTGNLGGWVLWNATAMDLLNSDNSSDTIIQQAARTATTCYMRGLSENIRIQTSSPLPWFWRRIVFTLKPGKVAPWNFYSASPAAGVTGPYFDGSQGIQRLLFNSNNQLVSQTADVVAQQDVLFKGVAGVDWSDPILAPVDTSRVTLKYDKTVILRSGNQAGMVTERKMWHRMNKNIVYGDDESGNSESTQYVSTQSKAGMGDMFVLDQFSGGAGAVASDLLLFQTNSTLYWHEK